MRQILRFKNVRSLGICLWLCVVVSAADGASSSSYASELRGQLFDPLTVRSKEGLLTRQGYDVNNLEAIKRATTDSMSIMRQCALHLLTYHIREQAIPSLKIGLRDVDPRVRAASAGLLGALGDLSGLEVMRRDLAELPKPDKDKEATGTSPMTPSDKPLILRSENGRLRCALGAAYVLAQFGDTSGYQLAAQNALKNADVSLRTKSISILTELGRLGKATLQARACDPEGVLLAAAESETDSHALECIASSSGKMSPESRLRILEKLLRSSHVSDGQRQRFQSGIERTKRALEQEKKKPAQ